jgi:hypothetical protein
MSTQQIIRLSAALVLSLMAAGLWQQCTQLMARKDILDKQISLVALANGPKLSREEKHSLQSETQLRQLLQDETQSKRRITHLQLSQSAQRLNAQATSLSE